MFHVKNKYDHEVEPIQSLKLATYTRLDMEIKLREALKAEGADKTGTDSSRSYLDDSDLPSLGAPDGK